MHIYSFNNLKFTLKHLKRSYMFRSYDHPQGAYTVSCLSYSLKHSLIYIVTLSWCCDSMSVNKYIYLKDRQFNIVRINYCTTKLGYIALTIY